MEEKDLIEQIKTAYNRAEKMLRVLPEEIGTTVRKTLEGAVRLFWMKKFQNEQMPSLYEALTDERFSSCFDEFVISDMHAIRKIGNSGNGGAHLSSKSVFLPKAEDLLARLKGCIKAIEDVLDIKIITPSIIVENSCKNDMKEQETVQIKETLNINKGDKFAMYNLLESFKVYCKTPGIDSGKAQSYVNAIQYLCDFLGVHHIDEQVVAKFKNLEFNIYRSNSDVRNNLLTFLKSRRQSSYLTGGFIRAALKYFYPFWEEYKNKNF